MRTSRICIPLRNQAEYIIKRFINLVGRLMLDRHLSDLKIESGQTYLTRRGETVKLMYDADSHRFLEGYVFTDTNGRLYNRDGRMYHEHRFSSPDKPSAFDIVTKA